MYKQMQKAGDISQLKRSHDECAHQWQLCA